MLKCEFFYFRETDTFVETSRFQKPGANWKIRPAVVTVAVPWMMNAKFNRNIVRNPSTIRDTKDTTTTTIEINFKVCTKCKFNETQILPGFI